MPDPTNKDFDAFLDEVIREVTREFAAQYRMRNEAKEPYSVKLYERQAEDAIAQDKSRITAEVASTKAKYEADIAQAIGYCQGLGHPDTYLEKRYPEIAKLKQEGDQ